MQDMYIFNHEAIGLHQPKVSKQLYVYMPCSITTAPAENQLLQTLCIYIRLRNGIKLKVMMSSQEMRQSSSLAYKSISQKHGVIQLKRQLNIVARQYCKKYKNISLFQSICIAPSLFGPPFESFSGTLLLITIFIRDPLGK